MLCSSWRLEATQAEESLASRTKTCQVRFPFPRKLRKRGEEDLLETGNNDRKGKRRVTPHQREILRLLAQRKQVTIGELASLLGVSSVAATKKVNRLEWQELVRRKADEWDRRRTLLILTEVGQSIVHE